MGEKKKTGRKKSYVKILGYIGKKISPASKIGKNTKFSLYIWKKRKLKKFTTYGGK